MSRVPLPMLPTMIRTVFDTENESHPSERTYIKTVSRRTVSRAGPEDNHIIINNIVLLSNNNIIMIFIISFAAADALPLYGARRRQ